MKRLSVLIVLILLIVTGLFGYIQYNFSMNQKELIKENEKLRKQLLQLEEENNNLKLSIKEWEGLMPSPEIGKFWVQVQLA